MAEAVLSSLVHVIFEKLSSQIFDEYGFFQGTKKETRKLHSALSSIQSVLDDAEDRNILDKAVKDWLIKLKDVAYDADDLLDEYMTEALQHKMEFHDLRRCIRKLVCNFFSQSNPILCCYRMNRNLENIVERLNTIADERFNFNIHLRENFFNVHCNQSSGRLQTDSYLHASEVFGRDEEKEKIITFLMDPSDDPGDVSVFPVVGMGGLGKTTLAKLVYNDKMVEEHFERRIWVCVSEEFDVKKIMRAVVESASGNRCDLHEMEAIHRSVQELIMKKRFLLVLDDVWNEDHEKWDRLKNSIRHGSEGSKVLVTTRSEKVALIMGTVCPYHLKGLSDENCWLLFQKRAFKNGKPEETSNLIVIGKEIARKCKGVPLAAKALGSSLALKRKDEWLHVRNSEMWNIIGEENGILPVLRLSYSNISSHLKHCFAYCSLFPKDYKIRKENLIYLWMAEGFIQPTQGKQLEVLGNEYFDELLYSSFFQNAAKDSNGDIVECELHHLLHDLAKSVAGNSCLMLDIHEQPIIPSFTHHLSLLCNKTDSLKSIRGNLKLRSLILFGQRKIRKISRKLIMRMKCLRALDISSTGIKELSRSVGALKHLRYLNLSHTHIKKLPDPICNLYNLETLLLLQCIRLEKLPENLRKLINLRHLNIYGCGLLSKLLSGIGELTSLKTLPIFIVGKETGCGITELKSLDLQGELKITNLENIRNGVGSVKDANLKDKRHITSLIFIWKDVDDANLRENVDGVIEALQPNCELKRLTIESYLGSKFPSWLMNHYLANLVELSLIKCCRCVQIPSLGKLPVLEVLTIDEMDATMYFCNDSKDSTEVADIVSLRRLSLKSMPNLLGWSSAEGIGLLSHLKELKVEDAPKLINLPSLPSIECLELIYCREDILMNATKMRSPSSIILGGFDDLVHFPQGLLSNKTRLLSLEIRDCPKLVNFSGELNSLSFLQSLSVSSCPSIECLSELGSLKGLKSLAIDRCHGLLSLPEEEIQGLTSLQHFSLSNCENITALPNSMQHFTNLQTLYIWSCPKVDSLPEWLGKLVSLRELELWYCDNLLYLPESMQRLTALQFLSIWGCPHLELHLEKDHGPDWYKIQHIPFIKINGPYIQAIG